MYRLCRTSRNSKPSIKYRIREIEENDLETGGVIEVLENLAPVGKLDRVAAHDIFQQIKSNPLHKIFVAVLEDGYDGHGRGLIIGTATVFEYQLSTIFKQTLSKIYILVAIIPVKIFIP
jgi:hypothetical protein